MKARGAAWQSIFRALLLVVALLSLVAVGSAWAADPPDDQKAQRRVERQRIRDLMGHALESFAAGENDAARAYLDSVLVADPANPDVFYFHGLIHLSEADTSAAAEILRVGVSKAPMSRRLKLLLARVQVEAGELAEAEALAREVITLRPTDPDAAYVLGLVALARGDSLSALTIWENAMATGGGVGR